ncbi:hypothetical protein A3715_37570 [Oleiphilus sp. HI0009]|nr:hypothetical protein A3715_37570 [Oleiphilus sp. HI0009]
MPQVAFIMSALSQYPMKVFSFSSDRFCLAAEVLSDESMTYFSCILLALSLDLVQLILFLQLIMLIL